MTLGDEPAAAQAPGKWDPLVEQMQALRQSAGEPSYATIAQRITERRMAAGATTHEARVARSTVYAAFCTGRTRINLELVGHIVEALGGDQQDVRQWAAACHEPAQPAAAPEPAVAAEPPVATKRQIVLLTLCCVALNLAGREFVDFFALPVHLDMVGTAIAALALGPWRGAAVGLTTNVVGIIGSGWISLPFALVNVAGALMWGYGTRRWGMGRTLPRFFALNVLTALVCSLIAIPVIVAFLGPDLRQGHDVITQLVEESVDTYVVAVGLSNLMTSVGDKLISGFVALVAVSALPLALRVGSRLAIVEQQD